MSDDLAPAYQDHRIRLAQATAAEELLTRVRSRATKPAEGSPAAPATAPQEMPDPKKGNVAVRAAKDVGLGVIETPRAVVKGVRDAYQSTIDIGDELGRWLESEANIPGLKISGEGVEFVSGDELQNLPRPLEGGLPDIDAPKSVTGGVVKGITQFLTGMKGAGKLLNAAGVPKLAGAAGYARTALQGAIANFAAFDPHQQRLSNLIEQFPSLKNPVTEYLASDPDDNAAEGRFKNALEGLGLGLITDGFFKGVKLLRQADFARKAIEQADTVAETVPAVSDDAFRLMGDPTPEAPLVQVKEVAKATGSKAASKGGATIDIDPDELVRKSPPDAELFSGEVHHGGAWKRGDKVDGLGLHVTPDRPLAERFAEGEGVVTSIATPGMRLKRVTDHGATHTNAKGVLDQLVKDDALPRSWMEGYESRLEKYFESHKIGDDEAFRKFNLAELSRVREHLQKQGYDGLIYKNRSERTVADSLVLFEEPRKLAIGINFARIDTPEDVKRTIGNMADLLKDQVDEARRGTQTFEQIKLNANQKDAWKALESRRMGEPLNAETALAARQLWASSGEKLTDLARMAADNPSESNLFAFRKMLSVHHAIQTEVIAARTETARALASWRIPAGGSKERLRDLTAVLDASGGTEVSRELAKRVAALGKSGMLTEMDEVVKRTVYARSRDAVLEGWIMGLLSNPTTHVVNTMSNSATIGVRMAERGIAAKIANALDDQASVAAGEAAQQWFGVTQGLKDMFRYYGKMARAALNEDVPGFQAARDDSPYAKLPFSSKVEHPASITSEALGISSSGWLGRAVDMAGSVVRIPGAALQFEDEFFKTIGYRMEINAQALRQATHEAAGGKIARDAIKQRVAELIQAPPENLRMAAVDSALYQTFTNAPGKLAQSLGSLTREYPMLKVILPFTRTPANILRFTFERTPLAPLMSQFRQNIAAGGARRDLALAQLSLGTAAMLAAADMAMSGQISGSGPTEKGTRAAQARQGWQPYSFKVGKKWYAYNRLDPAGSLFGMSADIVDSLRNAQHESLDDPDTERLAVAAAVAFAGNLTNKTYLSGLSSIFEAMADPNQFAEATVQRMAGSAVPAAAANVARLMDPYQRQVYSMLDAIKARTPGLSKDLPPKLNLWGDPIKYESGHGKAYDAFSPVYTREGSNEPIDAELLRLEANVNLPRKRTSFDGATVDLTQHPAAYSRYVELAGNGLKHPAWGVGAKDLLNAIVTNQHPLSQVYQIRSDGPDGGKAIFIQNIMRDYQEMARKQLLEEFPEIKEEVETKRTNARALRMPQIG